MGVSIMCEHQYTELIIKDAQGSYIVKKCVKCNQFSQNYEKLYQNKYNGKNKKRNR